MTNTLVNSENIVGNIGSCEVKSNTYALSSFYKETVAVNSCTGEIVSDTTWYDYSYVYKPGIIIVVILAIVLGFGLILRLLD
jgi:hypothetical protein